MTIGDTLLTKIRRRAEEKVRASEVDDDERARFSHELDVYRAELEMQVHELAETQEALRASRDESRALFEHAPMAYVVVGARGEVVDLNRAAVELLGVDAAVQRGLPFSLLAEGRAAERIVEAVDRAAAAPTRIEVLLRPPLGRSVIAEVFARRLPAGAQTLVTFVDRTDARRALEALRDSEARYRRLFDQSRDGLAVVDARGVIVQANAAAAVALGRARERRLDGTLLLDGVDDAEAVWARLTDADALQASPVDARARREGAAERVCELSATAGIVEPPGAYLVTVRDVTAARAEARDAEAARVHEQQRQRLESLGRLTGGVAHDMNNLLQVVLGMGALLQESAPGAVDDLGVILDAARRGAELSRNLLAFASRGETQTSSVNLARQLEHAAKLLDSARRRHHHIEVAIDAEPVVVANEGELGQVLLNLGVNALDAMPRGGTLSLRCGVEGDMAVLTVRDTGEGMDAYTLRHAFDPLYTTKGPGRGTGLGLSMVWRIAQNLGGRVELASTLGAGTCATVKIPRASGLAVESGAAAVTAEDMTGTRVLVVDDDAAVLDVLCRALRGRGCVVEGFTEGRAAVLAVAADPSRFDAAVLDVDMEGLDGVATARLVLAASPSLRVVFLSGRGELGLEAWRSRARVLLKPVGVDALLASVASAPVEGPAPA